MINRNKERYRLTSASERLDSFSTLREAKMYATTLKEPIVIWYDGKIKCIIRNKIKPVQKKLVLPKLKKGYKVMSKFPDVGIAVIIDVLNLEKQIEPMYNMVSINDGGYVHEYQPESSIIKIIK